MRSITLSEQRCQSCNSGNMTLGDCPGAIDISGTRFSASCRCKARSVSSPMVDRTRPFKFRAEACLTCRLGHVVLKDSSSQVSWCLAAQSTTKDYIRAEGGFHKEKL